MLGGQCTVSVTGAEARARRLGHVRCAPSHIRRMSELAGTRRDTSMVPVAHGLRRVRQRARRPSAGPASEDRAVAVVTRGVLLRVMLEDASRRPEDAESQVVRIVACRLAPGLVGGAFRPPGPPIGGRSGPAPGQSGPFWGSCNDLLHHGNGTRPAPIAAEKYNLDAAIPVRSPVGSRVVWQLHHARALGRECAGAR